MLLPLTAAAAALAAYSVSGGDESDVGERIGFAASRWGPSQWLMLHLTALNLPRGHCAATDDFERYLHALQAVLPCGECRDHFQIMLRLVPPRSFLRHGRVGAAAYVYACHCTVSHRLGKASCRVPFLHEEERLLREYVKAGSVDSQAILREMRDDARRLGLHEAIRGAVRAWKSLR